jgi:hypothetical protein
MNPAVLIIMGVMVLLNIILIGVLISWCRSIKIDYHGADRLGGTDNGEDVETVYKTVYKMSDYGNEPIIKDEEKK